MKYLSSLAAAALIILVSSGAAQALEIWQYDRLAPGDQTRFVNMLLTGTITVFAKTKDAAKIKALFAAKGPGPFDTRELMATIAKERAADEQKAVQEPDMSRLEVEDALADMLKAHGISVPDSVYMVNRDFRAKLPVRPM
jgi:hypothetical protein